ncbi:hypothetical protein BSKO_11263 [Bryopsis sp. KO-2023]|nr:hypothetical protein BSKO_11263 [Bryopsis sp. KO-2023]
MDREVAAGVHRLKERKNSYWLLRHGQSVANATGIVVASMEEGVKPQYGLTELGVSQAQQAGIKLNEALSSEVDSVFFYTSPFSRAYQTAQYGGELLKIQNGHPRFKVVEALKERFFGAKFELGSHEVYKLVWEMDARDIFERGIEGGESVVDVALRVSELIKEIEEEGGGRNIVLVAHGDTLSISAAILTNRPLTEHRQYGMQNCEILSFPEGPCQHLKEGI